MGVAGIPAMRYGQKLVVMSAAKPIRKESTQIVVGEYQANFYANTQIHPPLHHYIISRVGDPEILYWRQEPTAEDAEREARRCLSNMTAARSDSIKLPAWTLFPPQIQRRAPNTIAG